MRTLLSGDWVILASLTPVSRRGIAPNFIVSAIYGFGGHSVQANVREKMENKNIGSTCKLVGRWADWHPDARPGRSPSLRLRRVSHRIVRLVALQANTDIQLD